MENFITVDGGTTNTRAYLVRDGRIVDCIKLNIGAQKSIGSADALKKQLSQTISALLSRNGLTSSDIKCIPTSGMITSEFGIYNMPHIEAPAGLSELCAAAKEVSLPEICDIPFLFIPGVKTVSDELSCTDMMRGEETELIGLSDTEAQDTVYILPGSHSKLIKTDKQGRIVSFKTMLTGEMIAALSAGTILKDAVDLSCESVDKEYLVNGFEYALQNGINEALFKVRVLKNLFGASGEAVYSFFLGAVLSGEITALERLNPERVVIGGKRQLREAMVLLSSRVCKGSVCDAGDNADTACVRGAVRIARALFG